MRTIWKYTLRLTGDQTLEMQEDAKILTLQVQNDEICVWALVDPQKPKTKRKFKMFGTGHEFGQNTSVNGYIGTFQIRGGRYIYHVFEA